MKPNLALQKILLVMVLALLAGPLVACAPKLSREMLTPSPTITNTPLPSRTPDPRKPTRTPAPTQEPLAVSVTPGAGVVATSAVRLSTLKLQGLTVEEYNLGPAQGYDLQPGSTAKNQEFYEKIPPAVFAKRAALRAGPPLPSLEETNAALQPFGLRMETSGSQGSRQYKIYQGDELLFDHVTAYSAVQVNRSGSDFIFPITLGDFEVWVLRKDRFELWYSVEPRMLPIFVGDDVAAVGEVGEFAEGGQGVPILVNDQAKYHLTLPYPQVNSCPIEKFRAWGTRWVLEMDGEVLLNGSELTKKHQYEQVFNWQLVNGKEFFLFKGPRNYGVYYDGRELSVNYAEIVRWSCLDRQSAKGVNLSASSSDQMISFYARRGQNWFYVEIGSFE